MPAGPFLANLLYAALAVVALFAVTFAVALRQRRHVVVDVAWGTGFAVIAAVSHLASAGHGDGARRLVVLVLTAAWGLRLAWHIGRRSRGKGEDPRYEALLRKAKGNPDLHALRSVYLVQAAVMWFVSLPVQLAMYEPGGLGPVGYAGIALWAVGLFFEAVGDHQLSRFAADPANKGQVMDRGLWRYTRHPNYFGDATVWWGLFLLACDQWIGLATVLSPLLMSFFLVKGTGKPLLERRMARTRPGYAGYAARTSGFLPLPPRG
ncbi:DUF1295 domain-containing protein [Actinomadura parmotrematis]|uniref:DUF1295 domain-containing protein n=1 Tax=Actinomadura parmotrematis TaxID=2864039 RepID=UPI00355652C9